MFVLKLLRMMLKWGLVLFFASSVGIVLLYRAVNPPFTPLMLIRLFEQVHDGMRPRLLHTWVDLEDMPEAMPLAVVASEDQLFARHNGFDFKQIAHALEERETGRRIRGGSTISQQTAKNLFLWPSRSWVRKGFEAYFTVLIELLWPKERILEVYLNSIEMGPGIYGVGAVAHEHFGRDAGELSQADCALIAATLPNPLRYSSAAPSAYMRQRQRWILRQMNNLGTWRFDTPAENP